MIVGNRMTKQPVTVEPEDLLIRAADKMQSGGFRRVPVASEGKLVGIVSERDLREHRGHLEHTKINGVMSENPLTVAPATTLAASPESDLFLCVLCATQVPSRSLTTCFAVKFPNPNRLVRNLCG